MAITQWFSKPHAMVPHPWRFEIRRNFGIRNPRALRSTRMICAKIKYTVLRSLSLLPLAIRCHDNYPSEFAGDNSSSAHICLSLLPFRTRSSYAGCALRGRVSDVLNTFLSSSSRSCKILAPQKSPRDAWFAFVITIWTYSRSSSANPGCLHEHVQSIASRNLSRTP